MPALCGVRVFLVDQSKVVQHNADMNFLIVLVLSFALSACAAASYFHFLYWVGTRFQPSSKFVVGQIAFVAYLIILINILTLHLEFTETKQIWIPWTSQILLLVQSIAAYWYFKRKHKASLQELGYFKGWRS